MIVYFNFADGSGQILEMGLTNQSCQQALVQLKEIVSQHVDFRGAKCLPYRGLQSLEQLQQQVGGKGH